jgi:hypothetical protein
MKKFFLLILIVAAGYVIREKDAANKREKLVGVWSIERNVNGGWYRLS